MRIDVFTIFPDMVEHFADQSLLGRARGAGALDIRVHDLRAGAVDPHRSVDDAPFGGGVPSRIAATALGSGRLPGKRPFFGSPTSTSASST